MFTHRPSAVFALSGFRFSFFPFSGSERRCGLMVSALVPGSGGPESSSGRVHCFVVLGTTLYSHNSTFHQVYRWVPANLKSR